MNRKMTWLFLALLLFLPLACKTSPQYAGNSASGEGEGEESVEDQGTQLQGGVPGVPGLEGTKMYYNNAVMKNGTNITLSFINSQLVGTDALGHVFKRQSLNGTIVKGEDRDQKDFYIRINHSKYESTSNWPKHGGELFFYDISTDISPMGSFKKKACSQTGSNYAIAVPGSWDSSGAHERSDSDVSHFTFGCTGFVIARCACWGYKPWPGPGSMEDLHQVCTRMARADYCGDGKPKTREKTPIDFYEPDKLGAARIHHNVQWNIANNHADQACDAPKLCGVTQHTTCNKSKYCAADGSGQTYGEFEAAWTIDGAYCVGKERYLEDGPPYPHQNAHKKLMADCGSGSLDPETLDDNDNCELGNWKNTKALPILIKNRSCKRRRDF